MTKTTATELIEERANCNFDKQELHNLFHSNPENRRRNALINAEIETDPNLQLTHKYYEMSVQEKQEVWMKRLKYLYFKSPEHRQMYFMQMPEPDFFWLFNFHGQSMIGLHQTMFVQSVA